MAFLFPQLPNEISVLIAAYKKGQWIHEQLPIWARQYKEKMTPVFEQLLVATEDICECLKDWGGEPSTEEYKGYVIDLEYGDDEGLCYFRLQCQHSRDFHWFLVAKSCKTHDTVTPLFDWDCKTSCGFKCSQQYWVPYCGKLCLDVVQAIKRFSETIDENNEPMKKHHKIQ